MLRGRSREQALLDRVLAEARDQRSGTLVIVGEPGIGKSALLRYAAEAAADMRVLHGSGVESEVQLPFAVLHQLLHPVRDRIDGLPDHQATAVRAALGLAPGRDQDRFVVAAGVLTLLGEIAADRGLLCIVDDAHWLDGPTSDTLLFCARRLEADPVVLLFATREDHPRSFRDRGLTEIRLGGLAATDAGELLADHAPRLAPAVRDRIVAGTAGNPLALAELPTVLTDRQLAGHDPLPDPLPVGDGARRLFTERVRRLNPGARRLLEVAAADDAGDLALILRAAATLGAALPALRDAETAGLVEVRDGRLTFRHPLVRSAVYQDATYAGRRDVHAALAGALDEAEDPDRRAWHRAAAVVGPDEDVAWALERSAARAAARGGTGAAASALERAAGLSPSASRRGARLVAAASDWWTAGRPERVTTLLRRAESLVTEPVTRARLLRLRGLVELRCGTPDRAYPILLDAAATAADADIAADALVLAGEAASFTGDRVRAVEAGRLAAALPAGSSPGTRLAAGVLTGTAGILSGEWDDGAAQLRAAVAGALALRDPVALLSAGRAAMYLGDPAAARALHERAVESARATGALGVLTTALDRLAFSEVLLGRPIDATLAAEEGLRLASEIGQDEAVIHHLGVLALAYALRGDEERCRHHAGRASAAATARNVRLVGAAAVWAVGALELGLGRPDVAYDQLCRIGNGDTAHPAVYLWSTPDRAEAAARAGRPDDAAGSVTSYAQWAEQTGLPWAVAAAHRCRALIDPGATAGRYEAALNEPGNGSAFDDARTRLLYGETLRRERRRAESRPPLRDALATFERLGAALWAERARTELRASGETARRRDVGTLADLTPQELRIARLAGQGASNPEIAAAVFLSRRTVEYHLHKVFTKTGVTSRTELAELDLDGG